MLALRQPSPDAALDPGLDRTVLRTIPRLSRPALEALVDYLPGVASLGELRDTALDKYSLGVIDAFDVLWAEPDLAEH